MMVFESAKRQRYITYGEVLDMNTGNVIAEVHRAYQLKQNTYHRWRASYTYYLYKEC